MSRIGIRYWLAVKLALAAAILVGVGVSFWKALDRPELADYTFSFRWHYLFLSGILYLLAHVVWGLFWWRLLRSQGVAIAWPAAVRIYFVSQFGKYVPGKVWVLLLRIGLLRGRGVSHAVVAVTAGYETLTNMAAGAILAAVLVPITGIGGKYVEGNTPYLVGIAALPIGVWLFLRVVNRLVNRLRGPDSRRLPNPPARLLLEGLLQAMLAWCLLGVSLGAAVRGVHPDPPAASWIEYANLLAAVAASYVIGFIVIVSPGGLGPREFFLKEFLAADFSASLAPPAAEATAVVVTIVLRVVWTAFEFVFAAGWYLAGRTRAKPADIVPAGKGIDDHAE